MSTSTQNEVQKLSGCSLFNTATQRMNNQLDKDKNYALLIQFLYNKQRNSQTHKKENTPNENHSAKIIQSKIKANPFLEIITTIK
jgi:hypothetical protein